MATLLSKLFKNKLTTFLILGALVAVILFAGNGLAMQTYLNPGFEGAKCYFYGADFRLNNGWTGTNTLHRYNDSEPVLVQHDAHGAWDRITWGGQGNPGDVSISWHVKGTNAFDPEIAKPDLGIHVESSPKLEDITRQGDPLGWNETNPMDAVRYVKYDRPVLVSKEDTAHNTTLYRWEVRSENFLFVPAEMWLGFYLVPSQTYMDTQSGWREGEWQSITTWFRLDFTVWDRAYADPWLTDPTINNFKSAEEAVVTYRNLQSDYRGAFPIAGKIVGWNRAGYSNWTKHPEESSVWWTATGTPDNDYPNGELTPEDDDAVNIREFMKAKTMFAPSTAGSDLFLLSQPNGQFTYDLPSAASATTEDEYAALATRVKAPSSGMTSPMYFSMNIQNFGTFAQGLGWNNMGGWKVYYPTAYFRIRLIYGLYGKFTYLWTEEVAKDLGIPDFETKTTTVIHVSGPAVGLTGWLQTYWWLIIIVVVGIIFLFVAGPWIGISFFTVIQRIFRASNPHGSRRFYASGCIGRG